MDPTPNSPCPFAIGLTKRLYQCQHAQEVVRRGGAEYDCTEPSAHATCMGLMARLKTRGLAALGVEDDLATMPHGALVKVQCGGIAGLARLLDMVAAEQAIDIAILVEQAVERYQGVDAVPVAELEPDILAFKLERRTRRARS